MRDGVSLLHLCNYIEAMLLLKYQRTWIEIFEGIKCKNNIYT